MMHRVDNFVAHEKKKKYRPKQVQKKLFIMKVVVVAMIMDTIIRTLTTAFLNCFCLLLFPSYYCWQV